MFKQAYFYEKPGPTGRWAACVSVILWDKGPRLEEVCLAHPFQSSPRLPAPPTRQVSQKEPWASPPEAGRGAGIPWRTGADTKLNTGNQGPGSFPHMAEAGQEHRKVSRPQTCKCFKQTKTETLSALGSSSAS